MISLPVRSHAFFGRDEELSLLQARVDAAKAGEAACVIIRGERGSGKTRLVDEMRSRNADVAFSVMRCHAGQDAQRVLEALRDALAQNSLAVIIEDVDRAGPAVLEALASYEDRALLRIVTVSHQAEPSAALELALAHIQMQGAYDVLLGSLDDYAMRRIVAAFRVRGRRLSRQRVARVVHLSGGNPGLASEITRALLAMPVEDGVLVPRVILAQARVSLEKLAVHDRDVVSVASLIGENFSVDELVEISGVQRRDVVEALQHATMAGLLRETERGTFAFAHPLLHEAIRSQCTPTWAATYHQKIAATLASLSDDLVAAERSARHFAASGASDVAADESDRVAHAHFKRSAFLDAARNFRRASQLHTSDVKRATALGNLAQALRSGGFDEEALRVYETIVADRTTCLSLEEEAGILVQLLDLLWGRSEIARAKEIASRILAMDLPRENDIKSKTLFKLASFAAAAAHFGEMATLLDRLEQNNGLDLFTRANVAQLRGFAASATTSFDEALPLLRESVDLIDRTDNVFQAATLRRNFGMLAISHGHTELAMELLESAFERGTQANSESLIETTAAAYADALARCGRVNDARQVLDRVDVRTSDFGGVKDYFIVGTMLEIGSLVGDGELIGRAMELEESLVESALQSGESQRIASVVTAFAGHHYSNGNVQRAQALFSQALTHIESVQWNQRFCTLAAQCASETDLPKARALLVRDGTRAGRVEDGYVALFDAFAARRSGKSAAAVRYGKVAATRFAAVGWPLLQAQALEAAGNYTEALRLYELAGDVRDAALLGTTVTPRVAVRTDVIALTDRERTIALLAGQGLSNKEIAKRLSLGIRTVEFHLQGVYGKLGIKSRWQIPMHLSSAP